MLVFLVFFNVIFDLYIELFVKNPMKKWRLIIHKCSFRGNIDTCPNSENQIDLSLKKLKPVSLWANATNNK